MKKVAVIGSATIDRNVQGGRSRVKAGGVVTYAGLTYRRQGFAVAIHANVAERDRTCFEGLRRAGVVTCFGESDETTHFVNFIEGEERRQEMPCAARPLGATPVLAALQGLDLIHLGPLHPEDLDEKLLVGLLPWKAHVALDVQGYTRSIVDGRVESGLSERIVPALACARFVKAGSHELGCVLETLGLSPVDLMKKFKLDETLVTEGSRGGSVISRDGQVTPFRAHKIEHHVDPTGAGDVCFAAYLAARLLGKSIREAAEKAAVLAARHVAGRYLPEEAFRCSGAHAASERNEG